MIYAHAMQESIIHRIAPANSLSVHPVYLHFILGHVKVWRNYITKCLSYTKLRT